MTVPPKKLREMIGLEDYFEIRNADDSVDPNPHNRLMKGTDVAKLAQAGVVEGVLRSRKSGIIRHVRYLKGNARPQVEKIKREAKESSSTVSTRDNLRTYREKLFEPIIERDWDGRPRVVGETENAIGWVYAPSLTREGGGASRHISELAYQRGKEQAELAGLSRGILEA